MPTNTNSLRHHPPTSTGRFLRIKDVMVITGLARTTIYERMKRGLFPKSITIGPRTVVWLESEIQAWMDQTIAEARKA